MKETIRSLWMPTARPLTGARRVAMLLLTLLLTLTAQTAWGWDGAGTEDNPYLIKNVSDLNTLSTQSQTNNFDGVYFQLYDNITYDKTQQNNFAPIASVSVYFQGNFDGNGKTISGVWISTTEKYQGLFVSVGANGVVKNLKVADTRIEAYNMSGVITSYCEGLIADCSISSDVTLHAINPNGSQYGSIAGLVRDGTVSHCISEASITLSDATGGYNSMGGMVGELNSGTIESTVFAGSMQISSLSGNTNNFAVLGKLTGGTLDNNYYTSSSLDGGYIGVALGYIVTLPSQYKIKNSKGFAIDNHFYAAAGTAINLTSAIHPNYVITTCVFDVKKTSDNSDVATNIESSYVMPNYDITLIYQGILPYHQTAYYDYYNIYTDDSWDILADYVAEGWDTSGKIFSLYGGRK